MQDFINHQSFVFKGHFSLAGGGDVRYKIPVTFTTNRDQNYNDMHPTMLMESTDLMPLPFTFEDDDYIIFNLQGQGYFNTLNT